MLPEHVEFICGLPSGSGTITCKCKRCGKVFEGSWQSFECPHDSIFELQQPEES
jgi:hypothetical protein